MIGSTIGNYVVKDKIGEGGMGVVYVAEHPRIGRKVAIKVLLPEYSQNPEVVSRFFTEARASSAIKNEHIIDIIDFGELPDRSSYIIMEWLEGQSLTQLLEREGRLGLDRALHIARGIGRALHSAHTHGIVHRDLKPDNIFLVTRGDDTEFAKVLDFGIAKLLGNEGAGAPVVASKTRTGAIIGTPMYMSPEQCRGVPVDERSDVYSFGVIVYQMLGGQVPFAAEGLGELLLKHMTEPPRPLRELQPLIPEGVERAVLQALEKDPAKRFRRVADFVSALGGNPTVPMEARPGTEPVLTIAAPVTAVHAGVSANPSDTIGAAVGETMAGPATSRRSGGSNWMYGAVPLVLVLGAGLYFLRDNGGKPKDTSVAPAATRVTPVEEPKRAVVPPPAAPATVHFEVRTTTPGAKIVVDGKEVANPYQEVAPANGPERHVAITAAGYKPYEIVAKVDRDLALTPQLEPLAQATPAVGTHKGHKLPTSPAPDGKPEPKPDAKPDPKSDAPKAHDPDKGPTIYKGTKSKLDTNDPWAK